MAKVEQQKILRVFKLINLLRSRIGKNVHRLAETLETDTRTVYRYFKLLEEVGFKIEKEHGKFKIVDMVETSSQNLVGTFTEEESAFLAQAIAKSGKKNRLKDSLLEKIHARAEFKQSIESLFNAKLGLFVDELAEALRKELQVELRDYYSLHTDSVKDRLIEPVAFTRDYDYIHAFDVESKSMKKFKLERISDLRVSNKKQLYKSLHSEINESMFGYSGKAKYKVKLKLSHKAYQLLIEGYPEAKQFTSIKNRKHYYFDTEVAELPGVGRFVLGLPGEIEVVEGQELLEYLKEQKEKFTF
ncbi:WYL domain-containing protein [Litoribacter alkaliphilus]|uniref:WYL domain-containing protein n=1 Tax=Litoribacter ruber TaxID=702568 RepID=A0AAP2G672_9BACT|nr:WYL domain-containing protein [Litoribacter alkaliphilus]MBS9525756.1 WYL domain-containing protein [Litoribacter alkaliphilus]